MLHQKEDRETVKRCCAVDHRGDIIIVAHDVTSNFGNSSVCMDALRLKNEETRAGTMRSQSDSCYMPLRHLALNNWACPGLVILPQYTDEHSHRRRLYLNVRQLI
jgi:hypothetical protein